MYTRTNFGSFYPVESIIHSLNPLVKLINFLLAFLILILTDSLYLVIFLLVFLFVMMILSYVPIKYYFNTFYSLRYVYVILALICAYFNISFTTYIVYTLKIIIFFEYINILTYTTSSSESIYSIEKFLSLFNVFYLNVSTPAFKINSLLRYYPLYLNVKNSIINASVSRGKVYNRFDIKNNIKLHNDTKRLTSIKSNQILGESKLRLFDIKKKRTNYRTNKVSVYDIFCILFHIVLLYCVLIDGGLI